MEYLVVRAVDLLHSRGIEEVSLNFAAFARLIHSPSGRRGCLEEVEAHPDGVPVMGDVPTRQRRAQVGRPREERERNRAQHEQEPEARPPKRVEAVARDFH